MRQHTKAKAFTLIELVVVIVVVAILAAIALVAYNSSINQFENSTSESEAAQVSKLYQATSAKGQTPASALVANTSPGPGETNLADLPYAEDLPDGVTELTVAADGSASITINGATCTGVTFSNTQPGVMTGEWSCSGAGGGGGGLSVTYAAQSFNYGSNNQERLPTVSGSNGAVTYAVTNGTLPAGVSLNPNTGALTGPGVGAWEPASAAIDTPAGASAVEKIFPTTDGGAIAYGTFTEEITLGGDTLTAPDGTSPFIAKQDADGQWEWALTPVWAPVDGMEPEFYFYHVSVADDDSVFVAGVTYGDATFGTHTVQDTTGTDGGVAFIAKATAAGQWQWATGSEGDSPASVSSMALTSDGGAIVGVGATTDGTTAQFGADSLTVGPTGAAGFAKVNAAGNWQWATPITLAPSSSGAVIQPGGAANGSGGAYLQGYYTNAQFGGITPPGDYGWNTFVTEISSAGAFQWVAAGYSETELASITPSYLVKQSDGSLIVTGGGGWSGGGADPGADYIFGGLTLTRDADTTLGFAAKLSAAGNWQWAKTLEDGQFAGPVADPGGGVWISGNSVGGSTLDAETIAPGAFYTKITSAGAVSWITQAETNPGVFAGGGDIVPLPGGEALTLTYVGGEEATLGGLTVPGATTSSIVGKLSSAGTWQWEAHTDSGAPSYPHLRTLATLGGGDIIAGGSLSTPALFGAATVTPGNENTGVLGRMSDDGQWLEGAAGFPAAFTITATDDAGSTDVVLNFIIS